MAESKRRKIHIQRPPIEAGEDEALWAEVRKFVAMIPDEPDPNFGRVQEIKDEIRRKKYPTSQMINEAAEQIAARFIKKEI